VENYGKGVYIVAVEQGSPQWFPFKTKDNTHGVAYKLEGQQTCWTPNVGMQNYYTTIIFQCDQSGMHKPMLVMADGCMVNFYLYTPLACSESDVTVMEQ